MTVERPPEHVLAAFGLSGLRPAPLGSGWEGGWRCGEVVLSMIADHARAAWSAKVRETLFVDGVRLARPVRSTDGRYVVAGWRADTFVAGTPEPRHDEVVSAAVRLHEATAKLERPRFLTQPPVAPWADVDVFIAADRTAYLAAERGFVDDVIDPAETRAVLSRSLDLLRSKREELPRRKHGDVPL